MLPPLTLSFGTTPAVAVKAVATESYLVSYGDGSWCPALLSYPSSPSFPFDAVLGSPVLLSNVVIFDRAHHRVGVRSLSAVPVILSGTRPSDFLFGSHRRDGAALSRELARRSSRLSGCGGSPRSDGGNERASVGGMRRARALERRLIL